MGRLEALRAIRADAALADEILSRVSDEPGIAERVAAGGPPREAAGGGSALAPMTADRARAVISAPPDVAVDPVAEAIVLLLGRPVLLVRDGDVDLDAVPTETWRARLAAAREALRCAIPSVGRIELVGHPGLDWVGTGWVVDDDVVVTNRHVAEIFARREADRFVFRRVLTGTVGARIDFREEHGDVRSDEVAVTGVVHIEDDPGPDIAFLRVRWPDGAAAAARAPIGLSGAVADGREVAVIGYPARDSRTAVPEDMDRIFGAVYDVKRLAPGAVLHASEHGAVTHDCTTLGGNSGSMVLDLATGDAVALHFAGRERDRNYAVPAAMVRSRLRAVTRGPRPAVVAPGGPDAGEPADGARATADLADRAGYDPAFLGPAIPLPTVSSRLAGAVSPVTGDPDGVLRYHHYSVCMHRVRRLAMYVAVNIDGMAARAIPRAADPWRLDPRMAPELQSGNDLYRDNPLDRGHLVRRLDPAWGDTFEQARTAERDTFYYTNCAPQHRIHNQQLWLGLEDHILGSAQAHGLRISVFSGPVFRDGDRPYRDVLIPEDFWKVVALVDDDTGELSATAYVVSQRDLLTDLEFAFGPYQTYQVTVAEVEAQTGLGFGTLARHDPLGTLESVPVRPLRTFDDVLL